MRPSGGWIRGLLRFVASVLIVSGLMMLADAGVTLAWQEPVSAFMAARDQDELEDELDALASSARRDKELTASILATSGVPGWAEPSRAALRA